MLRQAQRPFFPLFGGGSACVVYIPAGFACVLGMRHSLMAYMKPRRSLGLTGHASTSSASILFLVRRGLRLRRIYPSRLRLRFRYEAQPDGIYETEAELRLNGEYVLHRALPCANAYAPSGLFTGILHYQLSIINSPLIPCSAEAPPAF